MALNPVSAFVNTDNSVFPDTESVNASGPTSTDGTEFVKVMIDNYMFGRQQALLNYASLTPNGLVESSDNSQEIEAMRISFGHPGESVVWYGNQDPSALGLRIILLQNQGILVSDYLDLVNTTYVGDVNNAIAGGFYRADDPAGSTRNINGAYFILPEARGLSLRGIDLTGLNDPDGATRLPGSTQQDSFQGFGFFGGTSASSGGGQQLHAPGVDVGFGKRAASPGVNVYRSLTALGTNTLIGLDSDNPSFGEPRVSSETRMKNIAAFLGIRY